MAKYEVTHSCGHTEMHGLFGPHKQRESKLEWLAGTPCGECYRAKLEAERATASATAAEANQAGGLPELTGSPKQIAWAETIRRDAMAKIREDEADILARGNNALRVHSSRFTPAIQAEIADALVLLVSEFEAQTEAKWWIDHRGTGFLSLFNTLQRRAENLCPQYTAARQAEIAEREVDRG